MPKTEPVSEQTTSTIPAWQRDLKEIIGPSTQDGKVAVVGVGHPLRGDDFVGSHIAKTVLRQANGELREGVYVFDAEAYVEVFITKLADLGLKHVVFVDACEMKTNPGEARLLSMAQTSYPFFTTHGIPLKVLAEQLLPSSKVWVLAIQPKQVDFGEEMSREVHDAAMHISKFVTINLTKEVRPIAD